MQHKLSITKWQSQFLSKGLHQARETCLLPVKCKCCKLSWSTQAPAFNLQTLPISTKLSSWGLYWIIPYRSPLRDLSALLLIEKLQAWGRELSPSTGPVHYLQHLHYFNQPDMLYLLPCLPHGHSVPSVPQFHNQLKTAVACTDLEINVLYPSPPTVPITSAFPCYATQALTQSLNVK